MFKEVIEMQHKNYRNKRVLFSVYAAILSVCMLTGFAGLTAEEAVGATIPEASEENITCGSFARMTGEMAKTLTEETKAYAVSVVEEYERKLEEERIKAEQERLRKLREESETKLLAALIFCEAGNQPYEGKVAVGAVVMNRMKSSVYPDTMREVIYQRGQFTPAMTGWLDSVLASGRYTESCMDAAIDALNGSNPIGDCMYFNCGGSGMKLGDHYFH